MPHLSPSPAAPRATPGRAATLDALDAAPILNPVADELRDLVRDRAVLIGRELGDPRLGTMFERQLLNTWETTFRPRPGGRVSVITGDIPAMWLRDSSAQLRPFLLLLDACPAIAATVAGVIAEQWDLIALDPYANAFTTDAAATSEHVHDLPSHPRVWERKYEVDSLAFPVQLAWQLWRLTGDAGHLTPAVHAGLRLVLATWTTEQHHARDSAYRFVRAGSPDESLADRGRGTPVADCGLTWSGFRPSDDRCAYGFNIPAQLFAAHACKLIAEMADDALGDTTLAVDARRLEAELLAGVRAHGVTDEGFLAYEVDGLGGVLVADDANMPSLLSLPLCSSLTAADPLYRVTRDVVLSPRNPYWFQGAAASGIGSPHTPGARVWPIALAVEALTSTSREDQLRLIGVLAATDAGTGAMHESFDADDPTDYTRPWFSWANSMFCELLLTVTSGSPGHRLARGDCGHRPGRRRRAE